MSDGSIHFTQGEAPDWLKPGHTYYLDGIFRCVGDPKCIQARFVDVTPSELDPEPKEPLPDVGTFALLDDEESMCLACRMVVAREDEEAHTQAHESGAI